MPRTYEILSRVEWMRRKDEETKARESEGIRIRQHLVPTYDPQKEGRPDLPWYNFDKTTVDLQIRDIVNQVKAPIEMARAEDKEMESLKKFAESMQKVPMGEYTEVALVGMQGVGKSSLINALLNRPNFSRTSAGGSACTACAVRYLQKPGADDRSDIYDAEVQFMDDEELEEVVREHAKNYHFYHFGIGDGEEPTQDDERDAETAYEFFTLVFDAANNQRNRCRLDELLSASAISDGSLARETIRMALERIGKAGADSARKKSFKDLNEAGLSECIDGYIAPKKNSPSLWPIVQYVNVYLGSALARNRVAVIDLPGM